MGRGRTWSPEEDEALLAYHDQCRGAGQRPDYITLGRQYGVTNDAVRMHVNDLLAKRGQPKARPVATPLVTEQEVQDTVVNGVREVQSRSRTIKTVDDLLRHIEADLTVFEVEKAESTKNEQVQKGPDGEARVVEYFRVFVRLKPKVAGDREHVAAMIDAAFAERQPLKPRILLKTRQLDVTQEIIAADAHIGKRAWPGETGGPPYDTPIAERLIREAFADHIALGNERNVGRRAFRILGDWSNHDTPGGTTTSGTQVEHDSRLQKILDVGSELLFDAVEESARHCPTVVMFVPGNHDEVLTWAFQKIVATYFRNHPQVTVDTAFTSRKYDLWGRTLLGFAHGDKAKKSLPGLMTNEASRWWGESLYREIHTGHLHSIAAVDTINGVLVRTAPSLSAIDTWHAQNGYVGALRGMETFYYHRAGGLLGMDVSCPDYQGMR